ncbi:trypsin [Dictyocaulus viviparus]|uniref:Trypsin n=1 Tax=Dictyocaulus viviparus TaxID=29172 RepID=A0A0D8X7G4_DICVI|nr:trypsin [Dictyocaulus viviparus]
MGSTIVENNEYPWTIGMRIDSPESMLISTRHILTAAHCVTTRIQYYANNEVLCSVLISTRHILTAAHCVTTRIQYYENNKVLCKYKMLPMSAIYVYPGTKVKHMKNIPPFTSSFRVVNMTIHNAYDPCKRGYDIALLEISPNMFSAGSAICMPSVNETIPKSLTSTGFGWNPTYVALFSNVLTVRSSRLSVKLESSSFCGIHSKMLRIADHPDTGMLQAVNLTVYGKTDYDEIETRTVDRIPCFGDSGGPLFTVKNGSYILLGITAQSELCVKENDEKVAVFEDVRTKITWICENSGVCPTESTTFK